MLLMALGLFHSTFRHWLPTPSHNSFLLVSSSLAATYQQVTYPISSYSSLFSVPSQIPKTHSRQEPSIL
ncbi:protein of unknown function [Vibrio tapetis subsp. tapetis]|uniref:Uncharacterized protein n=1 Tax=Vibrio tapetis subsp. tapetis TaxID=1671868 RepID=A0A2N8ZLZ2_9VIBR|nr:protein of unknown function [Vibrio tapetis subsp. tapetis]